jgi:hypothetical protein
MQYISEKEIGQLTAKKSRALKEFQGVMEFWDARKNLQEGDLVRICGTFSEFAPLLIGYPKAKRQLHREFRRKLEKSPQMARKKTKTINACLSISSGQMVWRDRKSRAEGVSCGLYESIVRNSIPVYVTRNYYNFTLNKLVQEKGRDTFEACVTGLVTKPDMKRLRDYIVKYEMYQFISQGVIHDLCKDAQGILVDGIGTSIDFLGPAKYLDGDIWVAGESEGREFFVTEFVDVGNSIDRKQALQALYLEFENYSGIPRLLGEFDEISELIRHGFNIATGEGPLEEIFRYGFGVRNNSPIRSPKRD